MPRPDRSLPQGALQQGPQGAPQVGVGSGMPPLTGGIREDIRALNSSILLITQKIKYIVRNEKILGRNLVVLNKKIKSLEEKIANLPQGAISSVDGTVSNDVSEMKKQLALLSAQVDDMRSMTATKEELRELKYVIDSINPLEFATLGQVRDLIDKRIKRE